MSKSAQNKSPDGVVLTTFHFAPLVGAIFDNDPLLLLITKDLSASCLVSIESVCSAIGITDLQAIYSALQKLESIGILSSVFSTPGDVHIFKVNPLLILINNQINLQERKRIILKKVVSTDNLAKWICNLDSIKVYNCFDQLPQTSRRLGVL